MNIDESGIIEFKKNGALLINNIFEFTSLSKLELDEEISKIIKSAKVIKNLSYSDMKRAEMCIMNRRQGLSDSGMIDIFHPDKISYELEKFIMNINQKLEIQNFLKQSTGKNFEYSHSNLYINENITSTRGMHVDNFAGNSVKLLIYLSDVLNAEFGPYAYMLGSHKRTKFTSWILEKLSNYIPKLREICFLGKEKIFFAEAGSGILSDQSGFHRGMPQSFGRIRRVLVLNYWCK